MNWEYWDGEVLTIAQDLDKIERYHQGGQHRERKALIKFKVAILQLQGVLSAILEKLTAATARKSMLPPKLRSLVHWGGVFAQSVHRHYYMSVQLAGKKMWIQLIRTRIPGNTYNADARFSDDQLVELSSRLSRMRETEHLLAQEINRLQRQRTGLEYRYQDLCAIDQNRQAAASMTMTLGRNLHEGLQHPLLKEIGKIMRRIARLGRAPTIKQSKMIDDLHRSIQGEAARVMGQCRDLVVEELRYPKRAPRHTELAQYEASLRQIEELQNQLAESSQFLLAPPQDARPILLKNHLNSGTTVSAN